MKIGITFGAEIHAAGLDAVPFTWDPVTGETFFAESATEEQREAVARVLAAHDPTPPPPVTIITVIDLYRRMTDAEYASMQAGVATQSPRVQGIFERADTFRSDAPEWPLLNTMAVQLYGEKRAAELLTP